MLAARRNVLDGESVLQDAFDRFRLQRRDVLQSGGLVLLERDSVLQRDDVRE